MLRPIMERFKRLGLQWRIMLYVTAGLTAFSAIYGIIALQAVQQSTDLVFRERLRVASTLARAIENDLARFQGDDRARIGALLAPSLEIGEPGYVVEVMDSSGAVVATNHKGGESIPNPHFPLVQSLWQAGQSGIRIHSTPTGGHVVAFVPLSRVPWGVVVEQGIDEALIMPRNLQRQFITLGLFGLLGGLALAWFTTRTVVHPINALIHASREIAQGDLAHPLDVSAQGEVGTLARSFDEMRVRLEQSREEIARWNRELETRVQQRTRELAALVASSDALTSTLNLDTLFDILMAETRQVFPLAEGIALFLFDHSSQTLMVRASFGFNADETARLRFRVGEAMAGKVFEHQAPVLFGSAAEVTNAQANFSEQNRTHFLHAVGERRAQSALGVPLFSKGARLGALILYNFSRQAAFAQNDLPILQALANQAATAIENARLYAELQQKEALRTQLLEKLIETGEEERKRIARDLHDEFAQTLTALTINLQSALRNLPAETNGLRQSLTQTQTLTTQTLKEISQLILELRPSVLDDLGLVPAIRWYAENRLEPSGTHVVVEATGLKHRLPSSIETALFRIIQEAISNAAKYAHAHQVDIRLKFEEARIQIKVQDDGVGFDAADAMKLKDGMRGLGLLGMRERAALLGGRLTIDSSVGRGTRVHVEVPWKEQT